MLFAGNAIWFVFGGALLSLIWLAGAALFAVSLIGLPVSRAAFEIAKISAFPFGKDVVHVRELDGKSLNPVTAVTGTIGFIATIIWLITFGWVLFLGHLIAGVLNCFTIIGIPFGLQSFKLAGISLWPVGRRVVTVELARRARQQKAQKQLDKLRGIKANAVA